MWYTMFTMWVLRCVHRQICRGCVYMISELRWPPFCFVARSKDKNGATKIVNHSTIRAVCGSVVSSMDGQTKRHIEHKIADY